MQIAVALGIPHSTMARHLARADLVRGRGVPTRPEALSEDSERLLGLAGPATEMQRAALEAAARLAARGAAVTARAVADELGHRGARTGYASTCSAIRVLRSLGRWPYDPPEPAGRNGK
jgi:hypothetical protein